MVFNSPRTRPNLVHPSQNTVSSNDQANQEGPNRSSPSPHDRLRLDGRATFPGERERLVEYRYVKASKRGNDVDAWRIDGRMRTLREGILPYCQSVEGEKALRTTRALYVTLTVNPALMDASLESAWLHVGRWFNDFKSRLSSTFGTVHADVQDGEFVEIHSRCKIHVLRSWEAHASGWPHVHAVLCFEDFDFKMFKDAKGSWRIKLKDRFEDAWPYGFVDVKALTMSRCAFWHVFRSDNG